MSDTSAQTSNTPSPFCLGRYLIDLPPGVEAFLPSASAEYRFGTVQTERVQMTAKQFAEKMEKREAFYRGKNLEEARGLIKSISVSANMRIIVTAENNFGHLNFGFEAYKLDGNVLFSMLERHYDEAVMWKTVVPELQTRLLPALRARAPDEIPSEPGLCIADGFIASDGAEKARERVSIRLDSKRWPDVYLSVDTSTVHKAEPFLLERMNKAGVPEELAAAWSQIKHLREGRHDVGPIKAEESLVLLPAEHGIKNTDFIWESHFALNAPFTPSITVKLKTDWIDGGSKPVPSISEKDAIQLFDAIVNSIRLRPTGPAKRSEAPTPKAPLGELAATGHLCPETGWWQCAEEGAPVLGGSRQYIRQGERMPDVVLQGKPSLWQKVKGEPPHFRRTTVWTLKAYPEVPQQNPSAGIAAAPNDPAAAPLPDLAPPTPTDQA